MIHAFLLISAYFCLFLLFFGYSANIITDHSNNIFPSQFSLTDTQINRLPIMAKSVLDLYTLWKLVIARGGIVSVINRKQWQEVIKGLNLPSSITSAAYTLREQ